MQRRSVQHSVHEEETPWLLWFLYYHYQYRWTTQCCDIQTKCIRDTPHILWTTKDRVARRTEELHHSHCSKADKRWHQIYFFYFQVGIPFSRFYFFASTKWLFRSRSLSDVPNWDKLIHLKVVYPLDKLLSRHADREHWLLPSKLALACSCTTSFRLTF